MSKNFDTSHVRNVGEFFSQHYLDAVLEGDLKSVLRGWTAGEKSGGPKTPQKALAALADRYFRVVAALADREPQDQAEGAKLIRDHHARLLEALVHIRWGSHALEGGWSLHR